MRRRLGYAPTEGTELYYEITGEGEPLVLLHAFSFDRRMWLRQLEAFAGEYTVVTYDLRGFGKSALGEASYAHADDLAALLDHLGIERAALLGVSLGGGAAINFAVTRSDRVRALVVVDPSLGGYKWSPQFVQAQAEVRAACTTSGVDAARARWLAMPMFAEALANPHSADALRTMVGDYTGAQWMSVDRGRPFQPPAIQRLGDITAPTLVLVGEHDVSDFQAIADVLVRDIPNVRRATIEGAGHMVNLEAPERFNDVVLEFLRGV